MHSTNNAVYRPNNMSNQQSSQSSSSIEHINPNIDLDFEENSTFQEGVMSKTFQRPDKSFFQEPKELGDPINKGNFTNLCQSRQI